MAGAFCTSAQLRPRSLFLSPSAGSASSLRSTRPFSHPMAVPSDRPAPTRLGLNVAMILLCLAVGSTSILRHEWVGLVARTAIYGLADQYMPGFELPDLADLPAMEPLLARVIDPRPTQAVVADSRPRRPAIQPLVYDVRPGDTLRDVATRFGVPQQTLLWNNELESAEQVQAGQRLTVLPMSGVLHRVRPGESATQIAQRYGVSLAELADANALEAPYPLQVGQMLIVLGGTPPTPTPAPTAPALPTLVTLLPIPTVGPTVSLAGQAIAVATATVEAAHAALVGTAATRSWDGLPSPVGAAAWQRDFILSVAGPARESQRVTGVPTSVTLAQAILESDWGRSSLAREAKNLFGIKAHNNRQGTAGVYNISTWEVLGGANVTTPASFKAYQTLVDSIVDHGRWFHEQPRYAAALAVRDDPRAFVHAISAAGYATDPAYAAKLIALMDRFNLYVYDGQ